MQNIAIVGSGIAGLGCAWLLGDQANVTVFEASDRPGGHVNTVTTPDGGVDTGFIVFNDRNYPRFTQLLDAFGVASQPSDMSFGVSLDRGRIEWAGDNLSKLFARRALLADPGHWRMLTDIARFNRHARSLIGRDVSPTDTLGAFVDRHHYSRAFCDRYLFPMAGAIWSAPKSTIRDFPAATLFGFFANHGLLNLRNRPQWRTVSGGSRRYVNAMARWLGRRLEIDRRIKSATRDDDGVTLCCDDGATRRYDHVILACNAPTSLAMLDEPSPAERQTLGAFSCVTNRAVLHTDSAFMPRRRLAWSSWNQVSTENAADSSTICVTYWMNRLQQLASTRQYFVTLNPDREPAPGSIWYETEYAHPVYNADSVSAQSRLADIQGQGGVWYAGAWCGHGFHEDGLTAASRVAQQLGVRLPWRGMRS